MTTHSIKGQCEVCARGALFLASIDRYDNCDAGQFADVDYDVGDEVVKRTCREWGGAQARTIEACFEGIGDVGDTYRNRYARKPRAVLLAIVRNIIANGGVFRPETELSKGD